jgi:hypothetical protein
MNNSILILNMLDGGGGDGDDDVTKLMLAEMKSLLNHLVCLNLASNCSSGNRVIPSLLMTARSAVRAMKIQTNLLHCC